MLPEFEYQRPVSLAEALDLMADGSPDASPLGGGTNLVVDMRSGRNTPATLIDLRDIDELRGIRLEDDHVVLGGGVTIAEVLGSELIARHSPFLAEAASLFGNPLLRNRATVGGNLADASPAADMAVPLLALGAEVELASKSGSRQVPLDEFMIGVRRTIRRGDELLTRIRWPVPSSDSTGGFYKIGLRKADTISIVSVAVMVGSDESGRCSSVRIALGAVAPKPMRAVDAEAMLTGSVLDARAIDAAARVAADATQPIDDVRASASYRRRMAETLVRRLLTNAVGLTSDQEAS